MLEQVNKENFQHMLTQFSTTELESMVEKFPYFQQAHLLLAKKYQQENNPKFDQQLQLAALYIQDRELLYTLFNESAAVVTKPVAVIEPVLEKPKQEVVSPPVVEKIAETIVEELETPVAPVSIQQTTEIIADDTDLQKHLEEIEKTAKELSVYTENPVGEKEEVTIESPVSEIALVPELPSTSIVEPSPVIPVEETEVEQPANEPVKEPVAAIEDEIDEGQTSPVKETPIEIFSRIEPHTFDEWLRVFNNKATTKEQAIVSADPKPQEDDELNQLLAVNISSDYLHEMVKEETTYAKGLEEFIEEQIQKHKQPEAKNTTSNIPATETMARVYEMQEKYSRAIQIYEALMLKFPEKKDFYIIKINKLKNIS